MYPYYYSLLVSFCLLVIQINILPRIFESCHRLATDCLSAVVSYIKCSNMQNEWLKDKTVFLSLFSFPFLFQITYYSLNGCRVRR